MSLWIRVESSLGDSVKVRHFAASLGISVEAAAGLLVFLWGKVAEFAESGNISALPDAMIEEWARWRGRKGRFAPAFRSFFAPTGYINDWDKHQGRLIEHRRKERERWQQRSKKSDSAGVSGGGPAEPPAPTNNDTTTATTTPTGSTIRESVVVGANEAAQMITRALNRGLQDNPRIGKSFNPVIATASVQVVADWLRHGIPPAFAEAEVYGIAKAYGGEGQIGSLTYCDKAVRKAWARSLSRPENGTPAPPEKNPVRKLRQVIE